MTERNLSEIQESLEKSFVHQNEKPATTSPIQFEPSKLSTEPELLSNSEEKADS